MIATSLILATMFATPAKITDIYWMSGTWTGTAFGGKILESFGTPDGGCILGTSRIVANGKAIHKEFVLLEEREGSVVYEVKLPSKNHVFKLKELGKSHAVWEDQANDWPTTITYRREGDTMHVNLDGGGRLEKIVMKRTTSAN